VHGYLGGDPLVVWLGAATRWTVVAAAGAGVMREAVCAIDRPRLIMMAAKITILRITAHSFQNTQISPRRQPNSD
jgi:hypothetical protein